MNENKSSFSYTYSSKEQKEVERIRKKYDPEENKLEELRRLDRSVYLPGQIGSIASGVIGTLIFGLGMCFCLGTLSVTFMSSMLLGIIISLLGGALMAIAYPIYKIVTGKRRKSLSPKIIRLSNEILGK